MSAEASDEEEEQDEEDEADPNEDEDSEQGSDDSQPPPQPQPQPRQNRQQQPQPRPQPQRQAQPQQNQQQQPQPRPQPQPQPQVQPQAQPPNQQKMVPPRPDGQPVGKTGLGKGKGAFVGQQHAKRHRKGTSSKKKAIDRITKQEIRRLARRGGVKRLNGMIYDEVRLTLKEFLETTVKTAVLYMEHARRKTVTCMDVLYALKRNGRPMYGVGSVQAKKFP